MSLQAHLQSQVSSAAGSKSDLPLMSNTATSSKVVFAAAMWDEGLKKK
jgi:hypothetical protein